MGTREQVKQGDTVIIPTSTHDVQLHLSQYDSVLDVGCGYGAIVRGIDADLRIGVDGSPIPLARAMEVHTDVIFVRLDIRDLMRIFRPKQFDAVVGFDILEHLNKPDGLTVMDRVEELAVHCVWWFGPMGWFEISADDFDDGNELLYHRSAWEPEDFTTNGYEVWHYPDWFLKRKKTRTSERGAFALKMLDGSHEAGVVHECRRFTDAQAEELKAMRKGA